VNGAASPVLWHETQFAKTIGAIVSLKVGAGGRRSRCAAEETATAAASPVQMMSLMSVSPGPARTE
jgi:hypothetical protein